MDLEEVKVCLRAIMSSTPVPYRLKSLLSDFKCITGFCLPLFGYQSPLELLKSLNDTVQLSDDPYNPEVVLIESKKSSHIISLVDRQKINDRNKCKNPYLSEKQKRQKGPAAIFNNFNNFSYKRSDSFLNKSISEKTKAPLIFQVGKQSFPHKAEPKPVPDSNPLTGAPLAPRVGTPRNCSLNQKSRAEAPPGGPPVAEPPSELSAEKKTDNYYFEDFSDNETRSSESNENSESISGHPLSRCCGFVNDGIKSKLKKLIKIYPGGLWCCELPELFFDKFNSVLDYREFGYTSLIQMLSELPDVFRCVRPGNEDWIVFDASVAPSPEEKEIADSQRREDLLRRLRTNLQKLLLTSHEDPSATRVLVDKVPDLYKKMFGESLDLESLGFKDVKSLLETWEGKLLNIHNVDGKFFCCPLTSTNIVKPSTGWKEALPPITVENDIFVEIFPKEVVGPEESLRELDLSRHIAVGQVVAVCVAEVWSPGKFFVQLNKFRSSRNNFMDDLQKFYSVHLNKYKMPDSTIRVNQICVGLFNADPECPEEWHRGQILKVVNEKTVLINFLDYGTVTRLKKSQLRFLHRSFQDFPVQAFQAHLSGIVPPNDDDAWPISTSRKFLQLLKVPHLNAEVVDIDFKKPSLSVILFNPKQKLNINDNLVQKRLAKVAKVVKESILFQEEKNDPKKEEEANNSLEKSLSSEQVPFQTEGEKRTRESHTKPTTLLPPPDFHHIASPRLPHLRPSLPPSLPLPLHPILRPLRLKRSINTLAMELLATNSSIREVGVNDPALALRIATKVAEALVSLKLPLRLGQGQGQEEEKEEKEEEEEEEEEKKEKEKEEEEGTEGGAVGVNVEKAKEKTRGRGSEELVMEVEVGGKMIHLVELEEELFVCSEEIVRQFTLFSNREVADRVLSIRKIPTEYKIICKMTNEKVLNALKSCDLLGVLKRKSKKAKVYLLQVNKVIPFLQALGCRTKHFENYFLELQENWEKRKCQRKEIIYESKQNETQGSQGLFLE